MNKAEITKEVFLPQRNPRRRFGEIYNLGPVLFIKRLTLAK